LKFAKAEVPRWVLKDVKIAKGSTVVILDANITMHDKWISRFKEYENDLIFKYFIDGLEAIEFMNSIEDKSKVFLFTDDELRNQGVNGIQDKHILVTNKYLDDIKEFKDKSDFLKMFPKSYLNDIKLIVKSV
jgi:hypothetical protein